MCVEGTGNIMCNTHSESIGKGETILIPAMFDKIEIKGTELELLEIYIK
jgi:mannose-6-phosphate isomerase